jgi:carbamoyltransferase
LLDLRLDFVSSLRGYTLNDTSAKQIAYLGLGIIRTLQIESRIKRLMQGRSVTTRGFNHHRCHAELFKFCGAPIRRVVTWDGRGEFDTAVLWDVVQAATTRGGLGTKSAELKRISSIQHPHSLGSFYAIFSSFLGFDLLSGPGKLMGLAPYGYFDAAIDSVVSNSIKCGNNEFKFELSTSFFAPGDPEPLSLNAQALKILGRSRRSDEPITQQHKNIAWSVQRELERASLTLTRNAVSDLSYEQQHMFFSGGVALNCVLNAQLFNVLRGVHLLPCSGDDGIALGAASLMRTILES